MTRPTHIDPEVAWMTDPDRPCATGDPERYFKSLGTNYGATRDGIREAAERAANLCAGCPVTDACLDYAIEHGMEGIWGGTVEPQRRALDRRVRGVAACLAS